MQKENIHLADLKRILLGEAPGIFMLEVFLRSILSFIAIIIVVKVMGKRMGARLTPTETAVMLMFGAIISSSMQIPDRGIIEACFVLFLVVIFQSKVTLWTTRNSKMEDYIFGHISLLVKDGVLQVRRMQQEKISHHQLFAQLRSKRISQLGEIKRVYMETSGSFSIYKAKQPLPGLSVYPGNDKELYDHLQQVAGKCACCDCGRVYAESELPPVCYNCEGNRFTKAVNAMS